MAIPCFNRFIPVAGREIQKNMRNSDSQQLENYFNSLNVKDGSLAKKARQAAEKLGLQDISLGPVECSILRTLVCTHRSRKFVEIGTLTGSSGLAILAGMPDGGELWTFEKEPKHAEHAEPILMEAAKHRHQKCEVILGDAQLRLFDIEEKGPFDGIFIDANKAAYFDYLKWAEKNIREGGIIIADNVFLGGGVLGIPTERFSEKQIDVMKEFNKRLFEKGLYESCFIPTIEGMLMSIKRF
jgi:predicted O-methyltransferase YrrM